MKNSTVLSLNSGLGPSFIKIFFCLNLSMGVSVSSFVNIKMLGRFRFNISVSAPGFVLVFFVLFFFSLH